MFIDVYEANLTVLYFSFFILFIRLESRNRGLLDHSTK